MRLAVAPILAVPLLFLSEAFVSREMLPGWLPLDLSPMTYLTRGLRAVTYDGSVPDGVILAPYPAPEPYVDLAVLGLFAVVTFVAAAKSLPRTD